MRIVRKTADYQGSDLQVAHIDLEGLDLQHPIDFDLEDLDFNITTYKHLVTSQDGVAWTEQLGTINGFLETLPENIVRALGVYFAEAYVYINREATTGTTLKEAATYLGEQLYDVMIPHGIPQRLIDYTYQHIPMPDLSGVVLRPHDTPEKTFGFEDFIRVTAISVLCKLLCPIWGDLIHKFKRSTDTLSKEMQCLLVITPTLTCNELAAVDSKLKFYIESGVEPALNVNRNAHGQQPAFTAAVNGYSPRRLYDYVYGTIMVKKFINVNPLDEDCNIMRWIFSCINASLSTLTSTLKKSNIGARFEPGDFKDGDDEGNVSLLEHESSPSTVTADVPMLMKYGAQLAAIRMLDELNIPKSLFEGAMAYYKSRPFVANPISQILVPLAFGRRMGGAKGVRYLDAITYMQLTTVLQIYIARTWQTPLINLLTSTTEPEPKAEAPSLTDRHIALSYKQFAEYRHLEEFVYPYPIGGRSFEDLMWSTINHVISYHHRANTDPMIQAILSDDVVLEYGELVPYTELVSQDICKVIRHFVDLNATMET